MKRKRVLAGLAALAVVPLGLIAGSNAANATAATATASASVAAGSLGSVTSGNAEIQGIQQGLWDSHSNNDEYLNTSGAQWDIKGTCASGNMSCTSAPEVVMGPVQGWFGGGGPGEPAGVPEFWVTVYVNGSPVGNSSNGYTKVTTYFNVPDNGTFPWPVNSEIGIPQLGYKLSGSQFQIWFAAGSIPGSNTPEEVGYIPDSEWGQTTFGPLTQETLQASVLNNSGNWTGTVPSMNWDFSAFSDSSSNSLGTASSSQSDYTVAGGSGTGFGVSGGSGPENPSTGNAQGSWPIAVANDVVGGNSNPMCVDDKNNGTGDGNVIQVWNCLGNTNENWNYDSTTGEIKYGTSGKCLDDPSHSLTNGTKLQLWTCNGGLSQVWDLGNNSNNFIQIELNYTSGGTQVCLDDPSSSTTNGTQLQVWACGGGTNPQNSDPWFFNTQLS